MDLLEWHLQPRTTEGVSVENCVLKPRKSLTHTSRVLLSGIHEEVHVVRFTVGAVPSDSQTSNENELDAALGEDLNDFPV